MTEPRGPADDRPKDGRYEIRLRGHLETRWAAWFEGMTLSHERDGSTVLSGPVVDQAALHGLLQKVRDIGLPLVSVTYVEPNDPLMTERNSAMTSLRKTAFVAGLLYLITYLAIPTIALYGPVLSDPGYIAGSNDSSGVLWGAVFELIVAFAIVGTGVALFPVLRRQNEGVALGFVTSRLFEAGVITVGIISLLSIVTLQQDVGAAAGADAGALAITGRSLIATHDWSFLIGQTLLPGINALLLGSLFYTSRLVPRVIPLMGLIGGPLLISSAIGQVVGVNEQYTAWSAIAVLPIFLWELALGLWLVFKGFRKDAPLMIEAAAADAAATVDAPQPKGHRAVGVASKAGAA